MHQYYILGISRTLLEEKNLFHKLFLLFNNLSVVYICRPSGFPNCLFSLFLPFLSSLGTFGSLAVVGQSVQMAMTWRHSSSARIAHAHTGTNAPQQQFRTLGIH